MSKLYFSHDYDSISDPKILEMRVDYGMEGFGLYFGIIGVMRGVDNHKILNKNIKGLSLHFNMDPVTIEKFINDCIEQYKLFESDGESFWSDSLLKRMAMVEEAKNKKSNAGKKGMQKRWNKNNTVITESEPSYNSVITENNTVITKPSSDITSKDQGKSKSKSMSKSKSKTHPLPLSKNKKPESVFSQKISHPKNIIPEPYRDLVDMWNLTAERIGRPAVTQMTKEREKAIQHSMRLGGFDYSKVLEKIEKSDLLNGKSGKWGGATFDWIFKLNTNTGLIRWAEILDGTHDGKNKRGNNNAQKDFLERHKEE